MNTQLQLSNLSQVKEVINPYTGSALSIVPSVFPFSIFGNKKGYKDQNTNHHLLVNDLRISLQNHGLVAINYHNGLLVLNFACYGDGSGKINMQVMEQAGNPFILSLPIFSSYHGNSHYTLNIDISNATISIIEGHDALIIMIIKYLAQRNMQ
jgi:hypothetical protein